MTPLLKPSSHPNLTTLQCGHPLWAAFSKPNYSSRSPWAVKQERLFLLSHTNVRMLPKSILSV